MKCANPICGNLPNGAGGYCASCLRQRAENLLADMDEVKDGATWYLGDVPNYLKAPDTSSPSNQQIGGDHYRNMVIQPAEYIQLNGIGFLEGTAIKYLSRWRLKGGIEDLMKARHSIALLIELETRSAEPDPNAT